MSKRIYPEQKLTVEQRKRGFVHPYAVLFQVYSPGGWVNQSQVYKMERKTHWSGTANGM